MNEKIKKLISQYKTTLKRKKNLLQPYIDKKNDDYLFESKWNIVDQENYSRLKAETEMLERHIEDLEYLLE